MPPVAINLIGIVAILAIAFLLSSGKKRIRLRVVGPPSRCKSRSPRSCSAPSGAPPAFRGSPTASPALLSYAGTGTEFLFGASEDNPLANTFALGALPVIIFFAALVSILYHLGIMQRVVRWVGGAIGFVTGHQQGRSRSAPAAEHLRRPVGKPAGGAALPRRRCRPPGCSR
jgi:CNT family concentrative nucleoside transporter